MNRNVVMNGKIPLRKGPGLDDKQHAFVMFGDVDRRGTSYKQYKEMQV